ncbi:MAG: Rrf2 family transcriptional regulator [Saccharospirillaceae bacterium]|nr:Rrf2 family transcriptional regulator [Pseudomonadales bacterium]NRB79243.1 Rrf2 family transcriptional regulator [Saccharospirillaceae bacterium]
MNISRFSDYSLRVLIYLSLNEDKLVTIKEISDRYQISKNHLMKVVHHLSLNELITSIRGKNGGIKLKQTSIDINIGYVVRLIEKDSKLVECFSQNNQCVITSACELKFIFAQALEQFYLHLDQYTLNDLVNNQHNKQLNQILTISI